VDTSGAVVDAMTLAIAHEEHGVAVLDLALSVLSHMQQTRHYTQ
jgi:hypothetical protein